MGNEPSEAFSQNPNGWKMILIGLTATIWTSKRSIWQLVPPQIHIRNAAKRLIYTFTNHFTAGLASTDKNLLIHFWYRLLPQAVTTLNLLQNSIINPRLLAKSQLNRQFNYDGTPMAPLGTKVIIHEKSKQRVSWIPHGTNGWYVGHAPHHYRFWTVYITKTSAEHIGDMVAFPPSNAKLPTLSGLYTENKSAL